MKMNAMIMTLAASLFFWACSDGGNSMMNPQPVEPEKVKPEPINAEPEQPEKPVQPEEPVINPDTRHEYKPVVLNEKQQAMNLALLEFSWKLFKEVYLNRTPGVNLMISPISLEVDLGMFINGLHGETLQQMLKTLGLAGYSQEEVNDFFQTLTSK